MRKALIATLGLATLGALASVQPASAGYVVIRDGNCFITRTPGPGSRPPTLEGHPPHIVLHVNWIETRQCPRQVTHGPGPVQPIQQKKNTRAF